MSLRRTALARKTELKRGAELRRTPLARKRELRARSVKAARPRDIGPDQATRQLVLDRAGGCCELCGVLLHDGYDWTAVAHSVHHRQARGMGGTALGSANSPANLLMLCGTGTTGCHGFITRHPRSAEQEGWIVRHGVDPAAVPVTVRVGWRSRWTGGVDGVPAVPIAPLVETGQVLLSDDGTYGAAA